MAKARMGSIVVAFGKILAAFLDAASPSIRKYIEDGVREWEKKAEATDNQFDDLVVDLIKTMLGIK